MSTQRNICKQNDVLTSSKKCPNLKVGNSVKSSRTSFSLSAITIDSDIVFQ